MQPTKLKVCYVVCYKHPDYIRTQVLVAALEEIQSIDLVVVKNKHRGIWRYIEVPAKLLIARLKYRPSVFIVGFRGYEVFGLLYPAMVGKTKIFDEFINLHDWLVNEHKKFKPNSIAIKMADAYMRWVMGRCKLVLTDTDEHAQLSRKIYSLPASKMKAVPVGADEALFYPRKTKSAEGRFEVFFFGNMLPLHGIDIIISAIDELLRSPNAANYHFTLAGGRGSPEMLAKIDSFIKTSPHPENITHFPWIDYAELPKYIARADLCLGGPFGDTGQASRVISGKTFQFIAMAKPTVIGRNPSHQLFKDKKNCLVVRRGNTTELAEAMAWAFSNRSRLQAIGDAGRQLYLNHYSTKHIAQELGAIFSATTK